MRRPTATCALTLAAAVMLVGITGSAARESRSPAAVPRLHDLRLQLTIFASAPDIVTPIGIAVDERDRVFVLESHTHVQPSDYGGPAGDRVRMFVDEDHDGAPDRVTTFAEGLDDGMNLAFSPGGELYVAAAKGVWALHDRDGDGVSETRTAVLRMVRPERVYDHAAIMGLAFSPDGWLYVSRGNTGSAAWRVEGTDGSSVGGYGDGGSVLRCRPDGRDVQAVATGFWNPFDLAFDTAGRLLATDNDPDSRGPNRLVHVIPGGDYGYQSLYGGSGIHPYLAWNGELPGTLPYAAALGEAPSGMLIAAAAALPADYARDVLVAIWEERTIARVRMSPRGTSVSGEATVLVSGDERFRPVAFAADSRGTIYVTDWVLRSYANHGQGRIWRLAAQPGVDVVRPRPASAAPDPDAGKEALKALAANDESRDFARLREALLSDDPFVRSVAIEALSRPIFHGRLVAALEDGHPRVRLGSLLALQRGRYPYGAPLVRRLLVDPDPLVRRMALIWAGRAGMTALEPVLERAVLTAPATSELFEVYLATLEQLTPEFVRSYAAEAQPYARQLQRVLRPRFLESFVRDPSKPAALRAIGIRHLESRPATVGLLADLAASGQPPALRTEAIRSLGMVAHPDAGATLLATVADPSNPVPLRADALVGLARQPADAAGIAERLLDDPSPVLRLEAARYLRSVKLDEATTALLRRRAGALSGADGQELRAQLAFATGGASLPPRPQTAEDWQAALAVHPGDPEAGRRVFFSTPSACAQCHRHERRGGDLGPDLTNAGRSKSSRQLLESILSPSSEISPEYQGWFVRTRSGEIHTGRQIDVGDRGKAELYVLAGEFVTIEDLEDYGPMPRSLMPDGLQTNLTIQDMRDLLAFLAGAGAQGP